MSERLDDDREQGSSLLASMPAILWQRKYLFLVPALLCCLAGISAAFLLPRTYESRAVLLVESPNLPGDAENTIAGDVIDRRIAKFRQQIVSRPDLIALIQANDLYDASRHAEPLSDLVERVRNATDISAVDADIGHVAAGRPDASSIAFSLTFDYPDPVKAQAVAQTFVDRLLKLDASESQAQAQDNVLFLQDQQKALQDQINVIEGEINQVTGQNGMALANAGGSAMMLGSNGGSYETQISALQRENAQLKAQIGGHSADRDPNVATAEAQLAAAKAVYADDHPDVKLAQDRLAAARKLAASSRDAGMDNNVRSQIAANDTMISELNADRANEQNRQSSIIAAQARGPAVLQKVNQLQARADLLRGNLGKVSASLINAQSVSKLADEARGERLTLVEPPVTPDHPTKPNRIALIVGGIVAGLALGIGLVLTIELILRPIRSVASLTHLVGVPPLGVIPIIASQSRSRHRRLRFRLRRKARTTSSDL